MDWRNAKQKTEAIERSAKRKSIKTLWEKAEKYDRQNLEAARIIAQDPVRYDGGLLEWAWKVIDRMKVKC